MSSVLIVEDEQHLADGLRFNLEAEGYDAEVVGDGEKALELLTAPTARYDAVVLDVMLPGIDGFTVAAELRKAGQFVPVLMLTAMGRAEDVLRGFEAGADDYLPKPFELAILLARLSGLFGGNNGCSMTVPTAWRQRKGLQENARAAPPKRTCFTSMARP